MVRKSTILGISVAAVVAAIGAVCYGDTLTIPRGTDVPLVFDQSVSSKTAKTGDVVMLHVAHDVRVGDETVIASGTKVHGVITEVDHRKHFGVNAKLRLAFDPVRSTRGSLIDIGAKNKGKIASGRRTDHAAEISGGGALLLGPVGLVGGYFVVGKQVNVKPGDRIISEVLHDTLNKKM